MVVLAIIAVVSVLTMKVVKAKDDYVNTYMTYSAFTNLQKVMDVLVAEGYDSNSDGVLEHVLPPFGHATETITCNPAPDPCTTAYGSGMVSAYSGSSLCVAASDAGTYTWQDGVNACAAQGMRLPSSAELNTMYLNQATIGGFSSAYYWSATVEYFNGLNYAWVQYFSTGEQYYGNEDGAYRVRCVRSP